MTKKMPEITWVEACCHLYTDANDSFWSQIMSFSLHGLPASEMMPFMEGLPLV